MKKTLLIFVTILFVAVALTSCKSKAPVCPAYRSHVSVEQPVKM